MHRINKKEEDVRLKPVLEPRPGESLGQYVHRARKSAEGKGLSLRQVVELVKQTYPDEEIYWFSPPWLNDLERDKGRRDGPNIAYLEALATVLTGHTPYIVSVNALRRLAGYREMKHPVDEAVTAALTVEGMRELLLDLAQLPPQDLAAIKDLPGRLREVVLSMAPLPPGDLEAIQGLIQHFRQLRDVDPAPAFPDDDARLDYWAVEEGKKELGL
jgi:transcriptional regulator with XRE-family HTH domain